MYFFTVDCSLTPPPRCSFAVLSIVFHQADVDNNNDERNNHQEDDDDINDAATMSKTTAKKGAAVYTKKPTMGMKTPGEDEADLIVSRPVSKLYGFNTDDKYAVSFDTEGTTDYCLVSFFISGVLPATGGYVATLSENGYTIRWSRPVDSFLLSMEHLRSIMGRKYSDSHVRVRSYNEVAQSISRDKIDADVNGLFWGKPQEIHLKKRCTGTVETTAMPYRAPPPLEPITDKYGRRHYQYHTIVQVKAQLAEQRKTATKKAAKTHPLEIYEIASSQGTTPSPGARRGKKRDFGGSHRQKENQASGRVSEENQAEESGDESEEY